MPVDVDVLKLVCARLEKTKIPYMLTGSLAANFYAVPRMTRDIDLVIELLEKDIDPFFQIFQKDFYISKPSIAEAIEYESMFNIIHNDSAFKIDFIIRKNIIYRMIEFKRRRRIKLDDIDVWIVSPEDLILSKLFWAKDSFSDLQMRDIQNLLSSMENLDKEYIRQWVQRLNLNAIYERLKDE